MKLCVTLIFPSFLNYTYLLVISFHDVLLKFGELVRVVDELVRRESKDGRAGVSSDDRQVHNEEVK